MKCGKANGLFDDHTKLRLRDWLRTEFGINHTNEILASQYDNIISEIQKGEIFKPNFGGSASVNRDPQTTSHAPRSTVQTPVSAEDAFNQATEELGGPF